jgi:purine-binding chemotaxis protein CheW
MALIDRLVDLHLSEDQIERVLDERAAALAEPLRNAGPPIETSQYMVFRLGEERYALEIRLIEEVRRALGLAPVPCTPDFIVGAINVRGVVLPVIDIRGLLGLPGPRSSSAGKIIVAKTGEIRLGILADRVEEVRDIGPKDIGPVTENLPRAAEGSIAGLTVEGVAVLNGADLIDNDRLIVHEEV